MSTGRSKARSQYLWKTYGLTQKDWTEIWAYQGETCGLCAQPIIGRKYVDHEHCRGYSKKPPRDRRDFVRAICHYQCNRFLVSRHTLRSARQLVAYLEKPPARMALR